MTIRERIELALRRQPVDQVPFTIYPGMIPHGEQEARLRQLGLGYHKRMGVLEVTRPNVAIAYVEYEENGTRHSRTTATTPVGEVYATARLGQAYGSTWYVDHYVKTPDDYKVVEFLVGDTRYEPAYDPFLQAAAELGEDGYVSAFFGYDPLMEMRVDLMGIERFALDMFDYPDLFWSLYQKLRAKQREAYPLLAESPADLVIYGGNHSPEVLGRRFEEFVVPCFEELGHQLHRKGKLLGCHLDANNALWSDVVARSQLDVIEAFTPAPDTDMSVAEARRVWPDKVLWINFPSSLHIASEDRIRKATREMLAAASPGHGFIMGVTEDVPSTAWPTSLRAIAEELRDWPRRGGRSKARAPRTPEP